MNDYHIVPKQRRGLLGLGRMRWWFAVVHSNGQIILTSETYSSQLARDDSMRNLSNTYSIPIRY